MPRRGPPLGYSWFPVYSGTMRLNEYGLCAGSPDREVARVSRRVDGSGWFLRVNRHRPDSPHIGARYATLDRAMRQAEAWAAANAARLPPGRP